MLVALSATTCNATIKPAGRSARRVPLTARPDQADHRSAEYAIYTAEGYEADDVIGTLCRQAEAQGVNTLIITGDTDTLQLVNDYTNVLLANPYVRPAKPPPCMMRPRCANATRACAPTNWPISAA
jgi:hypothetical protein